MGLPPSLIDSYRRYKKETGLFIQWLASTARGTGTVDVIFETDKQKTASGAGGRLKGKARKDAKKQGFATNVNMKPHQVPLDAFSKLAQAIAGARLSEVPQYIISILSNVIRARKDCALWYLVNQEDPDAETITKNEKHQYLISVLEEVQTILEPKVTKTKAAEDPTESEETRRTNAFAYLELHDLPETVSSIASASPDVHSKNKDITYEMEASSEEIDFAVYCLLKDATDIRIFVRRTWREFKRGEISLVTAALTTNAAVKRIENINVEFCEAFNEFSNHMSIQQYLLGEYSLSRGGTSSVDALLSDINDIPFSYEDNGMKLQPDAMLCSHVTEILWLLVVTAEEPHYQENPSHRLTKEEVNFAKCLSHLIVNGGCEPTAATADEISRAAWIAYSTSSTPTWVVFAIQIFWDIQRKLRPHVDTGLKELKRQGTWVMESLRQYRDLEDAENLGQLHRMRRKESNNAIASIGRIVKQDFVKLGIDYFLEKNGQKSKRQLYDFGDNFLTKNHPTLCGLRLEYIASSLQILAMNMAGSQGQITTAAHLYNAAHQSGRLSSEIKWADMDWLIEKQGAAWMFFGDLPKKGFEFHKQFHLAFGFDVGKLESSSSRESQSVTGQNRKLVYHAQHIELMTERRATDKRVMGISKAAEDIGVLTEVLVASMMETRGSKSTKGKRKRDTLSSLQTLAIFKDAIQEDDLSLSFDTMALYLRSIRLLRRIREHCVRKAPIDYPEDEYSSGLAINKIVGSILCDLGGVPRIHGSMFPDAVAILREVIEKEGDAEFSKAQKRCERSTKIEHMEHEQTFEIPLEDDISIEMRQMFGSIILCDDINGTRMPFGMR